MKQGAFAVEENELVLKKADGGSVAVSSLLGPYERPTYIYNIDDVFSRVAHMKQAFSNQCHIHFALKCNDHPYLLKRLAEEGLGVDIVSGGELSKAIEAGFRPEKIVFSGVGKTKAEINAALKAGISQINVESPHELQRIGELAKGLSTKAKVAFRLNPDVNAITHPYICTGFRENKFGMDSSFNEELEQTLREYSESLELVGVTVHIGSQLRELSASIESVEKAVAIFEKWRSKGFPVKTLDIGGGIGIDYDSFDSTSEYEMLEEYGQAVLKIIEGREVQLLSEPGRILVGRAGILVTQVQYLKHAPHKNFCVVDTGMHHLLRPSLYQAKHRIFPVKRTEGAAVKVYDVVGPICESSDVVGHDRNLGRLEEDDLLAVMDAGAYGRVMMSDYNSHQRPREVFVENGQLLK